MRAYRNVNLTLPGGLISLPISIATATGETRDPSPKVVGPEGEALRQAYLNDAGEEVDAAITKRDFDGKLLTQEQLADIKEQTKITDLEILEVAPVKKIDHARIKSSYYIYSHKKNGNSQAFATFVAVLAKKKAAAIVKWTPSSRQQLLALYPEGKVLRAVALAFGEDVKQPDDDVKSHLSEKVDPAAVEMLSQILESVEGDGESLENEVDEAIALKQKLIAGESIPASETKAQTPGKDFAEDLAKALKATKSKKVKA